MSLESRSRRMRYCVCIVCCYPLGEGRALVLMYDCSGLVLGGLFVYSDFMEFCVGWARMAHVASD